MASFKEIRELLLQFSDENNTINEERVTLLRYDKSLRTHLPKCAKFISLLSGFLQRFVHWPSENKEADLAGRWVTTEQL